MAEHKLQDWETFHNVIDNELTSTAKTRHGVDPSTGKQLPAAPVSTQEDVDRAVAAARAAFPAWSALTQDERAALVIKFADAVQANSQEFAALLGQETGKPPQGVGIELFLLDRQIRETVKFRLEEEVAEDTDEKTVKLRYVPLGVGVGITPWNFPMLLAMIKFPAALLTGNTFIWKPSPYSPYSALKMGEIGAKIFPKGVFQVLSGEDDLGPMLTTHPGVNKVSFTGSVATGKKVAAACASTLKRVSLELGGNDAAIVCEDADLATAIPKIGIAAYMLTGQVCFCVKRIYVHEKIYDAFLAGFVELAKALKVGPSTDAEAVLGPVQNRMQYDKLKNLYADIDANGYKKAYSAGDFPAGEGLFVPTVVLDNPPEDSRVVVEEQFGPVIPVLKWSDEEDVIKRANDTLYGLGGSVWSKDLARAERMARRLEAGTVWTNAHFDVGPQISFGGFKESGLGVESGLEGIKEWCNRQAVWTAKK